MPANKPKTEEPTGPQPSGLAGTGLPMAVGTVAVQAWMEVGTEAIRFVQDRLQQDIQSQQAMVACKSLEDMRKIQAEFLAAAQVQYATEASKMRDLLGKAISAGMTVPTHGRRYDDVPL